MKLYQLIGPALLACLGGCDDGGSSAAAAGDGTVAQSDAGQGDAGRGDGGTIDPDAGPVDECGRGPGELLGCADITRYGEDLDFVAQLRGPGTPHLQAVQDRCAEVFEAAGFTVERQDYGTGVNVIGVLPGVSKPDEHVLISAHYDHLPGCIGADDNASGTAGVLEAARVLGRRNYARTVVVACWDEEERGLVGSSAYVKRAAARGMTVHANLVFEMIGAYTEVPNSQRFPMGFEFIFPDAWERLTANEFRGDGVFLIGDDINPDVAVAFGRHAAAVDLKAESLVLISDFRLEPAFGDFRRSDHAPFWAESMPGIMVTDTANFRNFEYHCIRGEDDVTDVNVEFAHKIVQASIGAVAEMAEIEAGTPSPLPEPAAYTEPTPACDLLAQDCPDGERCAMVLRETTWAHECIPVAAEPAAIGDGCSRPNGVPGEDTCATGGLCTFWGVPKTDPQERQCRQYCYAPSDCEEGSVCRGFGGLRRAGGCVPSCTLGAEPDGCAEGTQCVIRHSVRFGEVVTTCAFEGAVELGASCRAESCAVGSVCVSAPGLDSSLCYRLCTAQADCGAEESCVVESRPGLPEGTGRCLPRLAD